MSKCLEIMAIINWPEIRGWIQLLFIVIGGWIGVQNFFKQQAQMKFNNSYVILNHFKNSLEENDIEVWKNIVINSFESVGVEEGKFKFYNEQYSLPSLFISEGQGLLVSSEDKDNNTIEQANYGGSIRRISEQFDLIGYQIIYGNADLRLIYFELGQLMDTIYQWLGIDNLYYKYPYFSQMYRKNLKYFKGWSQKVYVRGC
ncbi:hypothetical protein PCC7424_1652 [Gloeothece citriformis PCC 7424]|uniref:Uncharacterized protein n=1 Tax=Gloeothece citriformis (strain PCC 7424) TaxID=65393 RepID=B7KAY0_GLOC7|nr:hypothetical protein [Gloeothece citriformis]ACK70090.1 hypothetical protein PCC7424_1652 [Gloeothece citriformis PCC 7424]